MKTLLFKITLVLFVMVAGLPAWAQDRHYPSKERLQNIQNAKIAYITEKLNLTPEQSQKFWPLYNQLETERNALREKSRDLRNVNLEAMSDAEIRTALNNRLSWRQSELDLDKQYMDKFLRVISVRQLATLYRSEREFMKVLLKKLDAEHADRGNR
jgi:Spy/CpxP family protein refolding chaperone